MLIFAPEAWNTSELEDCARLMFPKVKEWNLPTGVIGPESGSGPPEQRPAATLRIWPNREEVQELRPEDLTPILDELNDSHCR